VKALLALLLPLILLAARCPAQEVSAEYRQKVEDALKAFEKKKYAEVITMIDAIPATGEDAAFLLNLKGAAYTKEEKYAEAKAAFAAALDISPGMFAARYNLGEILFLQRDFENAEGWFRTMLNDDPRNELLLFKVFLSQLQNGDGESAERTLSRMRFPGNTPAWYFAQAAWEHSRGNKGKASDYLTNARQLFPGQTEIYEETFSDLGLPRR
jgi:tetratricopeptide (TPR) repeat protein